MLLLFITEARQHCWNKHNKIHTSIHLTFMLMYNELFNIYGIQSMHLNKLKVESIEKEILETKQLLKISSKKLKGKLFVFPIINHHSKSAKFKVPHPKSSIYPISLNCSSMFITNIKTFASNSLWRIINKRDNNRKEWNF